MILLWSGLSLGHSPNFTQSSNSSSDVVTLLVILTGLPITLGMKSSLFGVTFKVLPKRLRLSPSLTAPTLQPFQIPYLFNPSYQAVKGRYGTGGRDKHFTQKEQYVLSPGPLARVISDITSCRKPLRLTASPSSHSPFLSKLRV